MLDTGIYRITDCNGVVWYIPITDEDIEKYDEDPILARMRGALCGEPDAKCHACKDPQCLGTVEEIIRVESVPVGAKICPLFDDPGA